MVLDGYAVSIISWNIIDFGRTKDDQEIEFIASIVRDFDIIAIQEVVAHDPAGAQAVARLADQLNRMGASWDYVISDPTDSPSSQISERYAYIWQTNKVSLSYEPMLVDKLSGLCDREPYYARFTRDDKDYDILNFHARPHDRDPQSEVQALSNFIIDNQIRFNWILLGDFNITEEDEVWEALYAESFRPSLSHQKTTLKRACDEGLYLNVPIDNIYFSEVKNTVQQSAAIDFVERCENLSEMREISDHLPVSINLD
jgi:endonuclease/exonuclease/phosphatase family metal-dependent hydrolase